MANNRWPRNLYAGIGGGMYTGIGGGLYTGIGGGLYTGIGGGLEAACTPAWTPNHT